jgi:CheY-like chemotaxis protein
MTAQYVLNPASNLRPILVVEDNDMDLDFCLQAFEEHAIVNPVIACRDGDEAIAFINTHSQPDDRKFPLLVLLDLRLPKIDGIEVLRHARQQANWQAVPFIVLTTSRDSADVKAAYQQGGNSYIVKPVDFGKFSDVVKHIKLYWVLTNESPFAPLSGN